MTQPFIFISTHAINEGKLEATREWNRDFLDFIAPRAPRLIAANTYSDAAESEMSFILVFPDAADMDAYFQMAHEKIIEGLELAPAVSIQVFGEPGPLLQEALRRNAEAGVAVSVKPLPVGGLSQLAIH